MENKVISGVYKIENTLNGKLYIGSSLDVMRRWRSHVSLLNRGTHYSIHLQNAWNKYGQKSFSFKVLSKVSEGKILLKIEQWHLDYYKPFGSLGYNVLPTAGSPRGYSFTEKHKENLSRSHTGHIHSMETRQKMSDSHKNRNPVTDDTRKKMSEARKRRKCKPHTDETKRKMSEVKLGKKFTEQHKLRISKARRVLSVDKVLQIQKLYKENEVTQLNLAKQFGVSVSVINKAIKNIYFGVHHEKI